MCKMGGRQPAFFTPLPVVFYPHFGKFCPPFNGLLPAFQRLSVHLPREFCPTFRRFFTLPSTEFYSPFQQVSALFPAIFSPSLWQFQLPSTVLLFLLGFFWCPFSHLPLFSRRPLSLFLFLSLLLSCFPFRWFPPYPSVATLPSGRFQLRPPIQQLFPFRQVSPPKPIGGFIFFPARFQPRPPQWLFPSSKFQPRPPSVASLSFPVILSPLPLWRLFFLHRWFSLPFQGGLCFDRIPPFSGTSFPSCEFLPLSAVLPLAGVFLIRSSCRLVLQFARKKQKFRKSPPISSCTGDFLRFLA